MAKVNISTNITNNFLITLIQVSNCKNTIFFGNQKKLQGIFSYYCLKIVNNAILKTFRVAKSPFPRNKTK